MHSCVRRHSARCRAGTLVGVVLTAVLAQTLPQSGRLLLRRQSCWLQHACCTSCIATGPPGTRTAATRLLRRELLGVPRLSVQRTGSYYPAVSSWLSGRVGGGGSPGVGGSVGGGCSPCVADGMSCCSTSGWAGGGAARPIADAAGSVRLAVIQRGCLVSGWLLMHSHHHRNISQVQGPWCTACVRLEVKLELAMIGLWLVYERAIAVNGIWTKFWTGCKRAMKDDWNMNGSGTVKRRKLNTLHQKEVQANPSAGKHLGCAEQMEHTWFRRCSLVEQLENTWMLLYSKDFWHYFRKLIMHKNALLTYNCRGIETFRELNGPMKVDCEKFGNWFALFIEEEGRKRTDYVRALVIKFVCLKKKLGAPIEKKKLG